MIGMFGQEIIVPMETVVKFCADPVNHAFVGETIVVDGVRGRVTQVDHVTDSITVKYDNVYTTAPAPRLNRKQRRTEAKRRRV